MQPNRSKNDIIQLIGDKAEPPHLDILMASSARLGAILSNMSLILLLIGFVLAIATLIAGVITAIFILLFALFVMIAIIFTLGAILLAFPEEWGSVFSFSDTLASVTVWLGDLSMKLSPVFLVISAVSAFISIIFLALDRRKNHIARIVLSCLTILLAIFAALVTFA